MSLNTAHMNGGVLIHAGECIILFSDHVHIEWLGNGEATFRGTKKGRIYLTTHRVIFNSKAANDAMLSFSMPFVTLSQVELEQPIFGANFVTGKVRAQPNGNWTGEVKFKMTFKHGGAVDFCMALLKVAAMANHNASMGFARDPPPPYVPPTTGWYAAPPPAYAPPPQGYYGWTPPTEAFPNQPPQNSVFMTNAPPPYPGIIPPQPPYNPGPSAGGGGGGGVGLLTAAQAKEAEAAQTAYYDPQQPQMAYVPPPPSYYQNPPPPYYNQPVGRP